MTVFRGAISGSSIRTTGGSIQRVSSTTTRCPQHAKALMMYYKRLREIDVPEMMASIITETPGKPWEYYRQMSRQFWDEARHAMMGEVGFNSAGVDWSKVPITWTWSLGLNTQLKPFDRHAVLYFIEQSLMPKTGKRYEWEVGVLSNDPLAALFQDYDWADEVLHAAIGRDWYAKEFPTGARRSRMPIACGQTSATTRAARAFSSSPITATGGRMSTRRRAAIGASSRIWLCSHTVTRTINGRPRPVDRRMRGLRAISFSRE